MNEHVIDWLQYRVAYAASALRGGADLLNIATDDARTKEDRITVLEGALLAIYHRLLGTVAEEWIAPNPRASERCAHAQYRGGLCEFVLGVLDGE